MPRFPITIPGTEKNGSDLTVGVGAAGIDDWESDENVVLAFGAKSFWVASTASHNFTHCLKIWPAVTTQPSLLTTTKVPILLLQTLRLFAGT